MSNPTKAAVTQEIVEVKVGDLWVDPAVQRALKKHRVSTMASKFDPSALGVLTTSFRSPRRIHIIDGQHRYRAAEAAAYTGVILTNQYRGLNVAQEAALFRLLNDADKVSAVDRFVVACVEQDPRTLHMSAILTAEGWTVSPYGGEGRLTAVSSLERVYNLDPNAAKAAVHVLTIAYGHRPAAMQGSLLVGLGRVLAKYKLDVDLDDLAKRLSGFPGGPDGLVGNARGLMVTRTGNLSTSIARVIVNLYNQRRRSTSLAPWE
jgi:hypothetical protein